MEKLRELELSGCVFKRCSTYEYDYIVALKKPIENFKSNEEREDVVDPKFAKFCCNGLITVLIYDLLKHKFINNFINDNYAQSTEYRVGNLVTPDTYDENIDNIFTHGIHYFLTFNAAFKYLNRGIDGYDCNGKIDSFFEQKLTIDPLGKIEDVYSGDPNVFEEIYIVGKRIRS